MGSTTNRRKPIVYDPGELYFQAGLLLCVTFGIVLAGIEESYFARDWGWFWFFVGGEVICVVLYFWIVFNWVRWIDHTDDHKNVVSDVVLLDERDGKYSD